MRYIEPIFLCLLLMAALVTRGYGIGEWPLYLDEFVTYSVSLGNSKDYLFSATYVLTSLIFKWFGASELTTRLSTCFFGVICFPVFYFVTKALFDKTSAVFASLFLLFSQYHLDQSQYARFYSASFFWGTLSSYCYFRFFQSSDKKWLFSALLATVGGILFHPSFIFLPFSIGVFSLWVLCFKSQNIEGPKVAAAKTATVSLILLGLLLFPYALYILNETKEYSLTTGNIMIGFKSPIRLLLQMIKYYGIPVCVLSVFSVIYLFKRDRIKGTYCLFCLLIPALIIAVFAKFFEIGPSYVMCIYPLMLMLSGFLISRIAGGSSHGRMLSAFLAVTIIASMLPEFISIYTSKKSYPLKKVIGHIEKSIEKEDKILSLIPSFNFYVDEQYRGQFAPYLFKSDGMAMKTKLENYKTSRNRLWIILEEPRTGINREFKSWLFANSRLVAEYPVKRFDYTFSVIRIFLKDGHRI